MRDIDKKGYVIGIDFGTLSCRCIVVDTDNGRQISESVFEYPHAVMDECLPDGTPLENMSALQHPMDYILALKNTVPDAVKKAGIDVSCICGIGVDFTTCTVIPTYEDGTPLCFDKKYESEPHAYVKLWKHTAALEETERLNRVARERNEAWLADCGGGMTSAWLFPKAYEILNKAPNVFDDTARFYEAGDWISLVLTGEETHSAAFAGYKAAWSAERGYPGNEYLGAVDQRMSSLVGTKVSKKVVINGIAGHLSEVGASLTGLKKGIPVALPMPDAHVMLGAVGVCDEKNMLMAFGTSGCQFLNTKEKKEVPGICGAMFDATIPGYCTYETGLICLGDGFDRFIRNFLPESYTREAREKGISPHKLLREKLVDYKVGQSGLIVLDWFNGNRSILDDSALSGMMLGLTLTTKPEEIYRAMIEATAFATRMIIENYEEHGISVGDICASGGIARKDGMMMQIYADVTRRTVRISKSAQCGALGSAIYASVAAGKYADVCEASKRMSAGFDIEYQPIEENSRLYDGLYREYKELHDYFGRGENDVMKRLLKYTT